MQLTNGKEENKDQPFVLCLSSYCNRLTAIMYKARMNEFVFK